MEQLEIQGTDTERKIYIVVCTYTSSRIPSKKEVTARNCTEAIVWGEQYFHTWCMRIFKIEVHNMEEKEPVLVRRYCD